MNSNLIIDRYIIQTLRCFTLFITHYPATVRLVDKFPHLVEAYHMGFVPTDGSRY